MCKVRQIYKKKRAVKTFLIIYTVKGSCPSAFLTFLDPWARGSYTQECTWTGTFYYIRVIPLVWPVEVVCKSDSWAQFGAKFVVVKNEGNLKLYILGARSRIKSWRQKPCNILDNVFLGGKYLSLQSHYPLSAMDVPHYSPPNFYGELHSRINN